MVAAQGTFITDVCKSDADCTSGCCAFNTGLCAARLVALESGGGCGFNGGGAAAAAGGAAAGGSGKAPATQFITGSCANDAECESGCCALNTGKCAARLIALESGGGCGFIRGAAAAPARGAAASGAAPNATAASVGAAAGGAAAGGAAAGGSGKPPGIQFITGPCANDAECASGCCALNTGLCAARLVALESGGGCGRGKA